MTTTFETTTTTQLACLDERIKQRAEQITTHYAHIATSASHALIINVNENQHHTYIPHTLAEVQLDCTVTQSTVRRNVL